MELGEIPEELKTLNGLELCLLCRRIPFIKLIKVPRGKQKGIKGATVNVPTEKDGYTVGKILTKNCLVRFFKLTVKLVLQ